MKKGWKIFWIVMAVIVGVGAVFLGTGRALGFSFAEVRDAYPNGIGIIRRDSSALGTLSDWDDDGDNDWDSNWDDDWDDDWDEDSEEHHDGTRHGSQMPTEDAVSYEEVQQLEMSVGDCKVRFLKSDDSQVKVDITNLDFGNSDKSIDVKQEDHTLKIQMTKDGSFWNVRTLKNMTGRRPCYGTLYVYLPENLRLEKADFSFGAAEIDMQLLCAEKLELQIGAAECVIKNLSAGIMNAEVGAGDLEISGDIGAGMTLKCGAGEIDIELEGTKDDYNYALQSGVGMIDIDGEEHGGLAMSKTLNNGSSRNIDITCGAGDVNLSFRQ